MWATGCGFEPYVGVRGDVEGLTEAFQSEPSVKVAAESALMIADLPFSFALDTLFLPFDLYGKSRQRAWLAERERWKEEQDAAANVVSDIFATEQEQSIP